MHDEDADATSGPGPTPDETARLVAPLVDALRGAIRSGIMRRLAADSLLSDAGISPPAGQVFALLRGGLPDRALQVDGVRATVRYVPTQETDAALAELEARGLVTMTGGELRLTGRGAQLQERLADITCDVVDGLWSSASANTQALERLADRALAHVAQDPGPAFHVLYPPYDPPRSTSGSRLAERLACLRFHRSDAHAAAWSAAGFTVDEVVARPDGLPPEVEADTDRRASAPYAALTAQERRELLDGLGALLALTPAAASPAT